MTKVTIDLDYEISYAFGIADDIGMTIFAARRSPLAPLQKGGT
jgi:hypothetical protein